MGKQAKENAAKRAQVMANWPLATGKGLLCACGHTLGAHTQRVVYDDHSETEAACVYCTDKTMLMNGVSCVTGCDHWIPRVVPEKMLREQIFAEETMEFVGTRERRHG
jgi:hypothetical protein